MKKGGIGIDANVLGGTKNMPTQPRKAVSDMREILFRGRQINNGHWIEGSLLIDEMDRCYIGQTIFNKPSSCYTFAGGRQNGKTLTRFMGIGMAIVLPETIGQYTGLTDKNGKKIFEGDIVSTDITRPYLIVEFRDGCFMFNCNDGGKDYYDIMLPILNEPQTQYLYGEVIGNIHDNPELLKGGEG